MTGPTAEGRATERAASLPLVAFLALFLTAWTLRATWLYRVDESIASPVARGIFSNLVKFLLWVVPALAVARWRCPEASPAGYLGLTEWPRAARWKRCAIATVAYLLAVAAFELAIGGKAVSPSRLAAVPPLLLLMSLGASPLLEEILFRGLILKELMGLVRPASANVLASLLFVAVHLPYWLSHGGLSEAMASQAVGVFGFSLVAGWLYEGSASVWPSTVAHIFNNLLASLLA